MHFYMQDYIIKFLNDNLIIDKPDIWYVEEYQDDANI
jgi:hypothetical protein